MSGPDDNVNRAGGPCARSRPVAAIVEAEEVAEGRQGRRPKSRMAAVSAILTGAARPRLKQGFQDTNARVAWVGRGAS